MKKRLLFMILTAAALLAGCQVAKAIGFSQTIKAYQMGKYQASYELWYTVKNWEIA
jgi:hypothetical protein